MEEVQKKEVEVKPFNCFPRKSGNSYVATIPSYYVKAGLVDPNKQYEFTMKEVFSGSEKEVESHEE